MKTKRNADETMAWLVAYTHYAPRTWAELLTALTGAAVDRDGAELTAAEDELVGYYTRLLCDLRRAGLVTRECASDPRFDLWAPARQ